ncbi:hypothetical protein JS608_04078 [Bacillus amyloliquefaciens]|nr:hypothetical protein JS608_04078 [Bacillus amyloliquefaciens]
MYIMKQSGWLELICAACSLEIRRADPQSEKSDICEAGGQGVQTCH